MTTATSPTITRPDSDSEALTPPQLHRFLASWLGALPSPHRVKVVPSARRVGAGWDGHRHPFVGIATGEQSGSAVVLSVAPRRLHAVRSVIATLDDPRTPRGRAMLRNVPAAVGLPDRTYSETSLRWSTHPTVSPNIGRWFKADEPFLPRWLRPFGGAVLVAQDASGRYLAGVGIKRHNRHGHELAVHTAPEARGRGLGRGLVAQAARRVLAEGAIPLYRHEVDNHASARVAEAAGFADHGWTWLGLSDPDYAMQRDTAAARELHSTTTSPGTTFR